MPETYTGDLPDDGTVTLTRTCDQIIGCGESVDIEIDEDGLYSGAVFLGEIEIPVDGATVKGEYRKPDPWFDTAMQVKWSATATEELWVHRECIKPEDYDPQDVENTVA